MGLYLLLNWLQHSLTEGSRHISKKWYTCIQVLFTSDPAGRIVSGTSTLSEVNEASFESLAKQAAREAITAASRLSRTYIGKYAESRTCLVPSDRSHAALLGEPPMGRTTILYGWRLKTSPFFICDPTNQFEGALFVRFSGGGGEIVNKQYVSGELALFHRLGVFGIGHQQMELVLSELKFIGQHR